MSREGSHQSNTQLQQTQNNEESTGEATTMTQEGLAVIREEKDSPASSSSRIVASKATMEDLQNALHRCVCGIEDEKDKYHVDSQELDRILKKKEADLRTEYDKILEKEMYIMKQRFDNILANEQSRASFMLLEAQRERQEKINALRSQLECKNLAALMYVMCTERRKSKLEKLRLIRDYTDYIHGLQDILSDGQELILHLSRGYKTAARVDYEWREKMKKVVTQFMSFIYHFCGGDPETNQFFIDLPKLLTTEAPIEDNPDEDPCEKEEEDEKPVDEFHEKSWWETLEDDDRPFVVFGDLADFKPPERRDVIKRIKAAKTAPKRWKQYCFNDTYLTSTCNNLDAIKDVYPKKQPSMPMRWECQEISSKELRSPTKQASSMMNAAMRRVNGPGQSIDIRGTTMGSLLKMITTTQTPQVSAKTALLGARDSMEITSTTKLRERALSKPSEELEKKQESKEVVLAIGRRRTSLFDQSFHAEEMEDEISEPVASKTHSILEDVQEEEVSLSPLGSVHNDSLPLLQTHVPDMDHKIVERMCPMEKCQRLQVDSFMRSLPPYMRSNPFTHFERTFDGYETCTPEQLEMLKQRIESRKIREPVAVDENESPLQEWIEQGVAVQTSELSMSLPPCTCNVPTPTPVPSNFVFDFHDLLPVKAAIDAIHDECLYDKRIDFDRFKVIGADNNKGLEDSKKEFKEIKYDEVRKILKQHPSLLDIFQANTQC